MYKVNVHFVAYHQSNGWKRKSSIGGHCPIKSGESMVTPNPVSRQILVKF